MNKIGIIVAMKSEFEALYNNIGTKIETINNGIREIYHYKRNNLDIYVTDTAEGEIAASSMTQYLITKFDVEMILNFGLCGSLNNNYKCKDLVVVKELIHYQFDISELDNSMVVGQYPGYNSNIFQTDLKLIDLLDSIQYLPKVKVASGDKFVGSEESKNNLINKFNCDICEMESAGIIITSHANNIPCLLIKCISDNASDDAHIEFREIINDGINQYVELIIKFLDKIALFY